MNEYTPLANDLRVKREEAGGFTFVELYDADDGDRFILGEDEIISLYKFLSPIFQELTRYERVQLQKQAGLEGDNVDVN